MDSESTVNSIKCPFSDHGLCTESYFLSRLERQLYGTAKLVLVVIEYLGCGKQRGDMAVMSAGMALALVEGCILKSGIFLYGKGIDIGTEHDGLSGLGSLYGCKHSGLHTAGTPLNAHLGKLFLDLL